MLPSIVSFGLNLNPFETSYLFVHIYALQVGTLLTLMGVFGLIFTAKKGLMRSKWLLVIIPVMVFGAYLVLWNFRIINIPYRHPERAKYQETYAKENANQARNMTFNIFQVSYLPDYISSRKRINGVYELTSDGHISTPANDSESATTKILQFNTDYHKKLGPNTHVSSDVISIVQSKPTIDIKQEKSRVGCCSSSYSLSNFTVIGKNKEGADIFKAYALGGYFYLTDYMGTRIVMNHSTSPGVVSPLTDAEAVKTFQNLLPIAVSEIDFTPN